jgi:hypothetical protein
MGASLLEAAQTGTENVSARATPRPNDHIPVIWSRNRRHLQNPLGDEGLYSCLRVLAAAVMIPSAIVGWFVIPRRPVPKIRPSRRPTLEAASRTEA